MALEERLRISENALKYWLSTDEERGFRTQMILAFLDTTNFTNEDDLDSVSELLDWFEFWEKILSIEELDTTVKKHKSYEYVKRTENLYDIRRKDPEPMLSMKTTIVKTFLKMATKISKRSLSKTTTTDTKTGRLCKQYGEPMKWEDINPIIVIFNAREPQTISVLCKSTADLEENEKKFLEEQLFLSGGDLQDLDSLSQTQMFNLLTNVVSESTIDCNQMHINEDYVITTDNLLKMVIINVKVESFVPIILMGDTGCGKTTLLQNLAKIKGVVFHSVNIHAGLDEIFIEKKIKEINDVAFQNPGKEFWLFLDEVNTNRNIGIFSDIIVHGHFNGIFLAPNVTVVAACNPYKVQDQEATCGLQSEEVSPIYNVYPLPEAMLDFVWDFGNITLEDEEKYIKLMINDVFSKMRCSKYPLKTIAAKSLSESQQFVRKCISSFNVSLREIERSKRLFSWFKDEYLPKMEDKKEINDDQCLMYWFMTLDLTYSSRFSSHSERTAYWKTITSCVRKDELKSLDLDNIENDIFQEKELVLSNMEMSSAIAVNRTLTENIFALFVCVLSRIPVCLIGKPGCSKSLSIQLLRNNMRGNESASAFFKKFPQLYFVSYQGSESSTPEGIEKVFDTAKHYQNVNSNRNVQVVILFDELGLAAKSRFQPLNALHSILEEGVDTTDKLTVSVIGLSNWAMDPAKMNRVLHVSCLDLTTEEMLQTAIAIYQNVLEKSELNENEKQILKKIATKYVEYIEQPDLEDFHCRRDFYSLIKYISTRKRGQPDSDIWTLISDGIKRNFGGLQCKSSLQTAEELIIPRKEMVGKKNVIDLIEENLLDKHSRHLMLISRSDAVIEKLILMLKKKKRKYTCIFGSQFEDDQYDDYSYRILSKIILCMEQGHVLVLKDLEMVYGSLFDMLNQNYSSIGERKHCRIALGPYSNPLCYVHEAFKCVVVVNKEIIIRQNAPLLSRFEKQAFSFQDSHCPKHDELVRELNQMLTEMTMIHLSDESVLHLPLKKLIPIHNNDMFKMWLKESDIKGVVNILSAFEEYEGEDGVLWKARYNYGIRSI
ncbi:E3 ubiquitin-protein ligase rnf213-beta-like [Saccostrea echinata]|uniref:E3 ubiquitin-protein ligase rnf213-beta-like n=1 Tax=Saccostrea echinata TaxID=191078 RepID=UPI002A82ACD7|nr:E3 ubiquitin-protein ligase rnf213-beta-like [Saccostrea echinata]